MNTLTNVLSTFNLTAEETHAVVNYLSGKESGELAFSGALIADTGEMTARVRPVFPKSDLSGLPQTSNFKLEAIAGDHATVVAQVTGRDIPVRITDGETTVTLFRSDDGWYATDGEDHTANPEFANA